MHIRDRPTACNSIRTPASGHVTGASAEVMTYFRLCLCFLGQGLHFGRHTSDIISLHMVQVRISELVYMTKILSRPSLPPLSLSLAVCVCMCVQEIPCLSRPIMLRGVDIRTFCASQLYMHLAVSGINTHTRALTSNSCLCWLTFFSYSDFKLSICRHCVQQTQYNHTTCHVTSAAAMRIARPQDGKVEKCLYLLCLAVLSKVLPVLVREPS